MLLKGDLRAHKDPWGSHKLRSCHFLRIPSILYIKIDPNDRKLFETQHETQNWYVRGTQGPA